MSAHGGRESPASSSTAPRPAHHDTAILVRRAAGSDAKAWEALVERFDPMIRAVARGHRLGEADVADVAQTVWLRLLEHLGHIREPERVGKWLATTARHESLRLCRQQGRVRPVGEPDVLDGGHDLPAPAPAPRVEIEERNGLLRQVVGTLPAQQRAMLGLLMADPPHSYGDVATTLGVPVGSIGPTRQRSLRTLKARCVLAGVVPG